MIDGPPTCKPCARRGEATLATWVLNNDTVYNWYLCDRHAEVVGKSTLNLIGALQQLPDAIEARATNRRERA